ncbi:MAG: recA bacterial recombination protein, partial [Verrucomicrobiota bacterium]
SGKTTLALHAIASVQKSGGLAAFERDEAPGKTHGRAALAGVGDCGVLKAALSR